MNKAVLNDFAVFILTHGRPDNVVTYDTLKKHGYTGRVYLVIDDEDDTEDQYRERYGDKVIQFSKREIEKTFDTGDNFTNKRGVIIYARNACFEIARNLGVKERTTRFPRQTCCLWMRYFPPCLIFILVWGIDARQ